MLDTYRRSESLLLYIVYRYGICCVLQVEAKKENKEKARAVHGGTAVYHRGPNVTYSHSDMYPHF